jgi:diamine N-acetyltransferase
MNEKNILRLRPLEREDLRFVHELDNNESVMHYWFEEPYEGNRFGTVRTYDYLSR